MGMILGAAGVVVLLALVIFPEFRKKLKVLVSGFLNIFVEDMAKTPEGAKAVFAEAIADAEKKYNEAQDLFRRLSGELALKQDEYTKTRKKLAEAEKKCVNLVNSGRDQEALIYAEQRSELMQEVERLEYYIQQLTPRVQEAEGIFNMCEQRLRKLKKDAKRTVEDMKMNESMKSILNDLDEMRRDTATDKMLGAVREGAEDLKKEVVGGVIAHQSKLSTKVAAAERVSVHTDAEAYIASLKSGSRPAITAGSQGYDILTDVSTIKSKEKVPTKRN